jgi:hypothetical protein
VPVYSHGQNGNFELGYSRNENRWYNLFVENGFRHEFLKGLRVANTTPNEPYERLLRKLRNPVADTRTVTSIPKQ